MSSASIDTLLTHDTLLTALFYLLAVAAIALVLAERYGWSFRCVAPAPAILEAPIALMLWRDDVSVLDAPEAFGYKVWTHNHDKFVSASQLNSAHELERRRAVLDGYLAPYLGAGWRLAALVAEALKSHAPGETVVSLLVDHSGSMRRMAGRVDAQPAVGEDDSDNGIASAATLSAGIVQCLCVALESSGVGVEVLGFTTIRWRGGRSRGNWLIAGKPAAPGRLNDLRHIVYKTPEGTGPSNRRSLGLMLDWSIYKENIDGEAIVWAVQRLMSRSEPRKVLLVISDGAPVDDSTLSVNDESYLERHLQHVVRDVERRGAVRLAAIGIGFDVARYYANSVTIDDASDFIATGLERVAPLLFPPKPTGPVSPTAEP